MISYLFRIAAPLVALVSVTFAQSNAPSGTNEVFDEDQMKALFEDAKIKNQERSEALPSHLNGKKLDLLELKPLLVEGVSFKLPSNLKKELDPGDLDALWERVRRVDVVEANLVRWQARGDLEFMLGTHDHTGLGSNEGRPSTGVTYQQLLKLLGQDKNEESDQTDSLQR